MTDELKKKYHRKRLNLDDNNNDPEADELKRPKVAKEGINIRQIVNARETLQDLRTPFEFVRNYLRNIFYLDYQKLKQRLIKF